MLCWPIYPRYWLLRHVGCVEGLGRLGKYFLVMFQVSWIRKLLKTVISVNPASKELIADAIKIYVSGNNEKEENALTGAGSTRLLTQPSCMNL